MADIEKDKGADENAQGEAPSDEAKPRQASKTSKTQSASDADSDSEDFAHASLRDLVANAGAAFDILNDDAPAAADNIEWNAETKDLNFEEGASPLEELTRRVAETASQKKSNSKSKGGSKSSKKQSDESVQKNHQTDVSTLAATAANLFAFDDEEPTAPIVEMTPEAQAEEVEAMVAEMASDAKMASEMTEPAVETMPEEEIAAAASGKAKSKGKSKKSAKIKKGKKSSAEEMSADAIAEAPAAELSDEEALEAGPSADLNQAEEPMTEEVTELGASTDVDEGFGYVVEEITEDQAEVEGEIEAASDLESEEIEAASADATDSAAEDEVEQMGFATLQEAQETIAAQEAAFDAASAEAPVLESEEDNDADPEPTEFVEADQLISIVESMLFSTDKPVSIATMKQLFKGTNVRTKDITRALDELASEYASATRGVTLEEINGGYQLRTKVDNAEFLKRLSKTRPFRLSGPALETMAIVAYKQPVTKHEIDEIRGVESGHLIRALMERGLVSFAGKAENLPGKPMAYGTTRKFLETFGLRNLKELPTLSEIDEILPEGIGEVEEKETLSDITAQMSTEITSTYSEGEDELLKINEQLQKIDTTSEFFEQEKQRERDRRDHEKAQDIREKIVLGDAVDEKDRRWLDRYEAKLHAAANPAPEGEPVEGMSAEGAEAMAEGEAAEPNEGLSEQLEALTAESGAKAASQDGDEYETENEAALFEDTEEIDELAVNGDWDDDLEAEKGDREV